MIERKNEKKINRRFWLIPAMAVLSALVCAGATWAALPGVTYYSEDFNYTLGSQLNASAGWNGTATTQIIIDLGGSYVRMNGGSGAYTAYHNLSYSGSGGIIWVHFRAKYGYGDTTMWGVWLDDTTTPTANNLARFYGAAGSCRGRIGGTGVVTASILSLTPGIWNDLDIKINTTANTSEFFLNGGSLGILDHTSTPSNTLGQIRFETVDNSGAAGHYLYFDELRVGQEPLPTNPPNPPTVTTPTSGSVIETFTPTISWMGDSHDKYEVHVNTTNNSADANSWDSGEVTNSGSSCVTGTLANHTRHYVFVRLHNSVGWGNWSAVGYYFDVSLDPPAAPTVTTPASGSVVTTPTTNIAWSGASHDMYEVHVNTTNNSADANGWDSGQVSSTAGSCVSGALTNSTRYYVFVRLRNAMGWGSWSASGCYFDVNIPLRIIPEPQQLTMKAGSQFVVNSQTRIVVNATPDSNDTFTANQLRRKVWDMTGFLPEIVQGGAGAPTDNVIAIGDPARNTSVASIIATWPDATGKTPKTEGYMLGAKQGSIVVRGFDQKGTFYGCQSLIQLLEFYHANISPLFCYDYPDLAWRGTMIRVWDSMNAEFLKEVISEIMARYKLNVVQLDIGLGTIWPSHTELYYGLPPEEQRANPTTLAMVVPIADWAKQHFMEVIPAGPSWSHSDGLVTASTLNTLLRENRSAPDPASGLETLCHRDPTAQQIIHDLWTDMINYFDPNYIHTGWDEISDIGHSSCPHCAGVSKNTLFNEFLTSDRNWMAARGIQMIMWADELRPDMNGGAPWNLSNTLATMPKDIILEDWEYLESRDNAASAQRWNNNAQPWLASPYGGYNPFEVNTYNWASISKLYPTMNRGLVAFNKFRCGTKEGVFANSYQWMEMGNMIFYGEWGWTANKPAVSPLPYDGETVSRQQISPDRPYTFGAALAGGNVNLTWTNPPDSTMQATWICYRTDRFPTDPTDGIFVADVTGTPNAARGYTHTLAPLGATIYYAAFSRDAVRHFSPSSTASVSNGSPLSLSSLTSMVDGKAVNVGQMVVTGAFQTCFYVENEARTCGLRVESTEPVSVGNIVTVNGVLGKTGTERSLAGLSVTVTGQKNPPIRALALRNSSLGGANKGNVPGSGGVGLNNVGFLVKTMGAKQNADPGGTYFYVNDGSSAEGIKVVLTGAKTAITIPSNAFMTVTGESSLDSAGKAIIRPRSQADIVGL